jgi:hypothetical protein
MMQTSTKDSARHKMVQKLIMDSMVLLHLVRIKELVKLMMKLILHTIGRNSKRKAVLEREAARTSTLRILRKMIWSFLMLKLLEETVLVRKKRRSHLLMMKIRRRMNIKKLNSLKLKMLLESQLYQPIRKMYLIVVISLTYDPILLLKMMMRNKDCKNLRIKEN